MNVIDSISNNLLTNVDIAFEQMKSCFAWYLVSSVVISNEGYTQSSSGFLVRVRKMVGLRQCPKIYAPFTSSDSSRLYPCAITVSTSFRKLWCFASIVSWFIAVSISQSICENLRWLVSGSLVSSSHRYNLHISPMIKYFAL